MIESRGFRNVHVALSVLEKLWRLRSVRKGVDSSTDVDWIDIVEQEGISLSLSWIALSFGVSRSEKVPSLLKPYFSLPLQRR